jgi:iron complex outermembrane receptor protein
MKNILLSVLLLFITSIASAQNKTVKGVVVDRHTSKPIEGATVQVKGTMVFASTDANGNFTIKASQDEILVIEHISYQILETPVSKASKIMLDEKKVSLDEIIIKSNPLDDISHSVVVMDDAKKGSQPRNAAELFNDISGFSIQKRSATASEPSFRAFKYEQMNIKYDGGTKIVHACPNRMDPITAHVIPEEVSKIEVVKGPFTVRFGQNFGAIVNMITRTPTPDDYGFHGSLQNGFETNGNNFIVRGELLYAKEKYDITLNAENRKFGDYTDGNGVVTPTAFTTNSYSVKVGYNPTTNQRLQLDWRQKFGKDIKHAGLPMDSPKDDSNSLGFDYKIQKVSDLINSISIKSYISAVDHLMTNEDRPSFMKMDAQTPVTSNTFGGKLEFGLTPNKNILIYAGLDADLIKRDGERTRIIKLRPDGTPFPEDSRPVYVDKVWQDAGTSDYGLFAEATYKISKNWALTSGLRTDFVNASVNDPAEDTMIMGGMIVPGFESLYGTGFDDVSENTFSGNIGLKYHKKGTQVQFAYGLGTRSASMIERYIYHFSIGADSYEYVGNPFLKPEQNNQFELAFKHKKESLNFGVSVFYSIMKDYISAVVRDGDPDFHKVFTSPFTYAKQFVNVDANQAGFDAYFNYKINSNLEFVSDIAYTKATNETFDEPLAQIAPLSTQIGVKYGKKNYWIDLRTRFVAEQDQLATSFGETEITPSYNTTDLRLGIEPIKGLKLGAAILNIFDTAYYNHTNFSFINTVDNVVGDRIYEPGRSFSIFAKYGF